MAHPLTEVPPGRQRRPPHARGTAARRALLPVEPGRPLRPVATGSVPREGGMLRIVQLSCIELPDMLSWLGPAPGVVLSGRQRGELSTGAGPGSRHHPPSQGPTAMIPGALLPPRGPETSGIASYQADPARVGRLAMAARKRRTPGRGGQSAKVAGASGRVSAGRLPGPAARDARGCFSYPRRRRTGGSAGPGQPGRGSRACMRQVGAHAPAEGPGWARVSVPRGGRQHLPHRGQQLPHVARLGQVPVGPAHPAIEHIGVAVAAG